MGGVCAQDMTPRSLWARLRRWLACLTSATCSQATQIAVEDGRQLISWAVSDNPLGICEVVKASSEGSKDSLPMQRFAHTWWECDEDHPQGLGPFLEGKEGIDMSVSGWSCFCFLYLFFIYLLPVFPLHLSFYLQRCFTPVQLGVCIFMKKNLSVLICMSILDNIYIFCLFTFLFFFSLPPGI